MNITTLKKYLPYVAFILFFIVLVWAVNNYFKEPAEVQGTSQAVTETETGVKVTAEKAGYKLDSGQANQVATVIREIRTENREPVYVVNTTGKEAQKESEQARKDNKADFSIVTDKDNPDYKVDLSKLDDNSKVTLNQYNIKAYKSVIRTIDYAPVNKQVTFTVSKKITNDGQYLGVGAGYDFEDNRFIAKISYSW